MANRLVDCCAFRTGVTRRSGQERARCRLAEQWLGPESAPVVVARGVCEACCRSVQPGPDRCNGVIASLVYTRASRAPRIEGWIGRSSESAESIERRAELCLRAVWSTPNGTKWKGSVPTVPPCGKLIDASVTTDRLAGHLRDGMPFSYLRYGDGEWHSILGDGGDNCDGSHFFPRTLGQELQQSLEYAAGLWPDNESFYMGLHATRFQDAIRRHLHERSLAGCIHWVNENLFLFGLRNLATRRFLEAVRAFAGPKVLVANESLAPVARGLACRHVVIPRRDCYLDIARIEAESQLQGPGLVLCCAGMASECLLVRLHRRDPAGTYVDCGHIFDALVGNRSRQYTREDSGRILDWLHEHYGSFLQ